MYIVLLIRMRIITLIIRIVLMYVSYISFDNDIMSEDCQHYHFYEYSHRIRSSPYLTFILSHLVHRRRNISGKE